MPEFLPEGASEVISRIRSGPLQICDNCGGQGYTDGGRSACGECYGVGVMTDELKSALNQRDMALKTLHALGVRIGMLNPSVAWDGPQLIAAVTAYTESPPEAEEPVAPVEREDDELPWPENKRVPVGKVISFERYAQLEAFEAAAITAAPKANGVGTGGEGVCPHCKGLRWEKDTSWWPPCDKKTEPTPRNGLFPCRCCNWGGWDEPLGVATPSQGNDEGAR